MGRNAMGINHREGDRAPAMHRRQGPGSRSQRLDGRADSSQN